jgi:hypothetical protein
MSLTHKMRGWSLLVLSCWLMACGKDKVPAPHTTIDVTPANAANIVEQTGAKVEDSMQQNTQALDAAIDAQSKGKSAP